MNKYIFILLLGVSLFSCKPETPDNSFSIEATIDTVANGKLAKLVVLQDRKPITKDSMIVADGKINFMGSVESPDLFFVTVDGYRSNLPFILENDSYEMTLNADSLHTSKVVGGEENKYFTEYQDFVINLGKENQKYGRIFSEARAKKDTTTMNNMRKKYDSLMNVNKEYDLKFIEDHKAHIASALILEQLTLSKRVEEEKASELYEMFTDEVKNSRPGKAIENLLQYAVGKTAPDFSAPDKDGNMVSLYDIKGKVTIIDFWAAWCRPCRMENPNVVKVYNKYHDKGLEIIGVSLDGTPRQQNAKEEWLKAIEDDSLTWYQVSNLKYFEGPVAKQYNITSIPATYILDADGKIVAKNLRGPQLEAKIAELLD